MSLEIMPERDQRWWIRGGLHCSVVPQLGIQEAGVLLLTKLCDKRNSLKFNSGKSENHKDSEIWFLVTEDKKTCSRVKAVVAAVQVHH